MRSRTRKATDLRGSVQFDLPPRRDIYAVGLDQCGIHARADGGPRIAHLISSLAVGGAERQLIRLLKAGGPALGRRVIVLTDDLTLADDIRALDIPVDGIGLVVGKPILPALRRIFRLIGQERPDVLQTWLYHADLVGTMVARTLRIPHLIWNIRCSDMELSNYRAHTRTVRWLLPWLSRLPDAIVVNSQAGEVFHRALGYRNRRFVRIPNGFDPDEFRFDPEKGALIRQQLGVCPEALVVGLVARWDPMKDHATFLAAAAQVAQADPRVVFFLAGRNVDAENTDLVQALAGHGLGDRVRLLGERTDIPAVLSAVDVAVSASAFGEGFSNALGEALMTGIPCVATDVGDAARIITEDGCIVPPRAPEALAQAILSLMEKGRCSRRAMGDHARARMITGYTTAATAQNYRQLYADIMAQATSR